MEISNLSQQPASAALPNAETSSSGQISTDFETFLKMLTVQLQNQDPLNPTDPADYAVQLATFSGVEQQVQTNDLLRDLAAQMTTGGLAQLAGWVGMEARSATPVAFTGSPVTLNPPIAETADAAELVVRDDAGNEVQRLPLDPRQTSVEWAGATADGAPLPNGTYRFDVVSYALGQQIAAEAAASYRPVAEVRVEGGQTVLVMSDGSLVPVADVTAVRDPAFS